jgi:hypothetical protein
MLEEDAGCWMLDAGKNTFNSTELLHRPGTKRHDIISYGTGSSSQHPASSI